MTGSVLPSCLDRLPSVPGQGAMAIEVRAADTDLLYMLNSYGDPASDAAVTADRAMLAELHGGCSIPVGVYAVPSPGGLTLTGQVTSLDGAQRVAGSGSGAGPLRFGADLAATLLARGAEAILRGIRAPV